MKYNFNFLVNNVIKPDLCSRCGACVGSCTKRVLQFTSNTNYIPQWKNEDECTSCGTCVNVCPALGYEINDDLLSTKQSKTKKYYKGNSLNNELFNNGTSGGVVTTLLLYLLNEKIVDKVVVVRNTDDIINGYAQVVVTDDPNLVVKSSQSKYIQLPVASAINEILKNDGKYAVVGLPCHLAGINKAERIYKKLNDRIVLKLGLFCGYSYSEKSIDGLLAYMGVEKDKVKNIIGWRSKGFPGNFSVKLKTEEIKSIPFKEEHCINVPFFALNRCYLCMDCFAQYSDVAFGDIGGWKEKCTLIVSKNKFSSELLQDAYQKDYISLTSIDQKDVDSTTVIPFMRREKRDKVYYRIKHLEKKKKNVPIWNYRKHTHSYFLKLETNILYGIIQKVRKKKVIKFLQKHPKYFYKVGEFIYIKFGRFFVIRVLKKIERMIRGRLKNV